MNSNINPWFITGICDGDSSFIFSLTLKDPTGNKFDPSNWKIKIQFELVAHNNPANLILLEQIQAYFGGIGKIYNHNSDNTLRFTVFSIRDCIIIRNHFINYPLFTYKIVYFQLWCSILNIIINKEHLTWEGLLRIIAFKAHFKNGLSALLISAFFNYKPVPVPNYNPNLNLMNIHWIAGFMNADGSFSLLIRSRESCKLGRTYDIRISITQDNISLIVLNYIQFFLGFGKVKSESLPRTTSVLIITSMQEVNMFIAKFNCCKFLGSKALDYADFCKGVDIINSKGHLTVEGLDQLELLSEGMNSTRTKFN